jgi:hypothetical protein
MLNFNAWAAAVAGETTYRFTADRLLENIRLLEAIVTCACRKSNPNILVVQPAENWATTNVPG